MDGQLRAAAALINTGFHTRTMMFTTATIQAIKAIDPATLVKTIPAGSPARLQNQVLLVFSELAARRNAFNPILEAGSGRSIDRDSQEGKRVLEGLSHGTAAAVPFPADLATARSLARSTAPFPVAARDSRASAEVAVRADYILSRSGGCGASGGWVHTTPAALVWPSGWNGGAQPADGTIGGIPFHAEFRSGGWQVELRAC